MRSIFWKIFLSFWLAMVLITGAAVLTSFQLARTFDSFVDEIDRRNLMQEAAFAVESGGVSGFRSWLDSDALLPADITMYLVDEHGVDALGRSLPPNVRRKWIHYRQRLERRQRRQASARPRQSDPRGQVEYRAPDGQRYRPILGPLPPRVFGVLGVPSIALLVLTLGMLISAAVCYALSRYLARPISRIASTAEQLASGNLSSRVGQSAYRADEIGVLARQFDQMARELEHSEAGRRDLFRNISHELRSPLARIHVALELASRVPGNAERQLERIGLEAQHMDALIAQVLELVRVQQEPGREASAVDVSDILHSIVEDARFEGQGQDKRVALSGADSPVLVAGYPEVIASAIENVLRNAIAHTPAGSTVDVSLRCRDGSATIQVCDKGDGVPDADLERLFEPFYRQNDNTLKGAGVGLAITAQGLAILGGTATARNADSGGLCVELTMPVL